MNERPHGAELAEIEAVYRRRLAELRRVATAITGSREQGLDAVQDAFALAVQRRGQFRGEGSLDGWLWRIVVNSASDRAAAEAARSSPAVDEVALVGRNGSAGGDWENEDVHRLVSLLPERQRLVLFLRFYADLEYAAIAEAVEISVGTVGATLSQALENLRRLIEEVRA